MTIRDSTTLKTFFETGDRPTQSQFADLIDSIFASAHTETLDAISTAISEQGKTGYLKIISATDVSAQDASTLRQAISPLTASGDLYLRSGTSDTRLGVGTSGSVLRGGPLPTYGKLDGDFLQFANQTQGSLLVYGSAATWAPQEVNVSAGTLALISNGSAKVATFQPLATTTAVTTQVSSVTVDIPDWAGQIGVAIAGFKSTDNPDVQLGIGTTAAIVSAGYISNFLVHGVSNRASDGCFLMHVTDITTTTNSYMTLESVDGTNWIERGSGAEVGGALLAYSYNGSIALASKATLLRLKWSVGKIASGRITVSFRR